MRERVALDSAGQSHVITVSPCLQLVIACGRRKTICTHLVSHKYLASSESTSSPHIISLSYFSLSLSLVC